MVRLQYNKTLLVFLCLLANIAYSAPKETSLKQFRSTEESHGLYEINEVAVKFLEEEKKRTGIERRSLEPNFKIWVPLCAVPLRAAWTPKEYGRVEYSVAVYCDKTVDGSYEKKWRVDIPTAPIIKPN